MLSLRDANIANKRVLLRVDFNVPLEDKKITDNFRMRKSLPTIEYLLRNRAKVIIITHLGKPDGNIIPQLSTIPLAQELAKILKRQVHATDHVIHPLVNNKIDQMGYGEVLVLGNLRWHPEEEANVDVFARDLSRYADIYVNDAFGVSHRAHASVEAITKYLPSYAGFLMEAEVTTLSLLLKDPVKPFLLIMGGAKIKDKAGLINNLAEKADKILIGGAIGNTFLAAAGRDVSKSLYEPAMVEKCQFMLEKYKQKLVLPIDSSKEENADGTFNIMDIGPNTVELFKKEISIANTVFWNGNMGYSEKEPYDEGTKNIAEALTTKQGTTVVSGGDTVGFVDSHGLTSGINFISTGGGATLEFLAGIKMPGIEALNRTNYPQ